LPDDAVFCHKCGAPIAETASFLIVTTPTVASYRIKKSLRYCNRINSPHRGIWGQFVGGIESMIGGEVTTFSSEVEKVRWKAIDRIRSRAKAMWV